MNLINKIFLLLLGLAFTFPSMGQVNLHPGDASNNGRVDNIDLLLIGASFGNNGPARNDDGTQFDSIFAQVWQTTNVLGVNDAYVDCDGSGFINANDVGIVELHYGKTYGAPYADTIGQGSSNALPDLYLDSSTDSLSLGTGFNLDFFLGTGNQPAEGVYGLAFTLRFDTSLVDEDSILTSFNTSFLNPNDQAIRISKVYYGTGNLAGKIDVAISKINKQSASGFGNIGTFSIVMEENVSGKTKIDLNFELENVYLVNENLESLPVTPISWTGQVCVAAVKEVINFPIKIYPNPIRDQLHIDVFQLKMDRIKLYNGIGQLVAQKKLAGQSQVDWPLAELPDGIYYLTIETNKGIITKKILAD